MSLKPLILIVGLPAAVAVVAIATTLGCGFFDRPIARDALVEDVEQLAWIILDAHPDPYERCGGKAAFDAKLAETIAGIPEEGMRRSGFTQHLMPFVAFVGDAHTVIHAHFDVNYGKPGGIPLYFGAVGEELYVRGVTREAERQLIGARLASVEGIPFAEIVARLSRLRPLENQYGALAWLGKYGDLWCEPQLSMLLPEWTDHSSVTVSLLMPEGGIETVTFDLPRDVSYPPIVPESAVTLPSVDRCRFAYSFLDTQRTVALLRVTGMMHYREALEMWESYGSEEMRRYGREAYQTYHGSKAPSDYVELMAGVPSATETFRDLVSEMKEADTKTLLVDLRQNSGGNSFMSNILVYFLFGKETLLGRTPGLEVEKYSGFFFEARPGMSLDELNKGRTVSLAVGDCDTLSNPRLGVTPEVRAKRVETLRRMKTFAAELDTGTCDGHYTPQKVIVLSSAWTFSSGYTMMRYLYRAGAELAGTPSSQASNCFGDILPFELPNSGVTGSVSHKRYADFPDDPGLGRVLPMDYPLTYDKLREYRFDPNAEVRWGMELGRSSHTGNPRSPARLAASGPAVGRSGTTIAPVQLLVPQRAIVYAHQAARSPVFSDRG